MVTPVIVPAQSVTVCDGQVIVGACACRAVREMLITSLGPNDDDLRVDVADRVVSDTRLNVSSYTGESIGAPGSNPNWPTSGFRVVRLAAPGYEGQIVQIFTTDVGGNCQQSPISVRVEWEDGPVQEFVLGASRTIFPPAWPAGTIGSPSQLTLPSSSRPPAAPGSPPIWVPLAEWVLNAG